MHLNALITACLYGVREIKGERNHIFRLQIQS